MSAPTFPDDIPLPPNVARFAMPPYPEAMRFRSLQEPPPVLLPAMPEPDTPLTPLIYEFDPRNLGGGGIPVIPELEAERVEHRAELGW